ncbi:hypothetical protein BKA70DRAFT_1429642 [Coprinopsis sp. MPI-PUGE-AT-0042]|nr:hypothetical protein BKA70DRAFT_1429642 [Coprinopsis sp. MPI-PUGE-AT-0042]
MSDQSNDKEWQERVRALQKTLQELEEKNMADIKDRDKYAGKKGASDRASHKLASGLVRSQQMRIGQIKKQLKSLGVPQPASEDVEEPQQSPSTSDMPSTMPAPATGNSTESMKMLGKRAVEDVPQDAKHVKLAEATKTEDPAAGDVLEEDAIQEEPKLQLLDDIKGFELKVPPHAGEEQTEGTDTSNYSKNSKGKLAKTSAPSKVPTDAPKKAVRRDTGAGHMADKWDRLMPEQQTKLIEEGDEAMKKFEASQALPSYQIRTWARREPTYLAEAGDHSEACSMAMHIIKGGKSQCAAHTVATTRGEKRHDCNTDGVTGVPWGPLPGSSVEAPAALDTSKESDEQPEGKSVSHRQLHHLLLNQFPMQGGRRTLHCGCDLNEALFGFWLFKRVPVAWSRSVEDRSEPVRPLDPLTRHIIYRAFSKLGFRIVNLYRFDTDGNPRNPGNIANAVVEGVRSAFFSCIPRSLPPPPAQKAQKAPQYVDVPHKEGPIVAEGSIFDNSESE